MTTGGNMRRFALGLQTFYEAALGLGSDKTLVKGHYIEYI